MSVALPKFLFLIKRVVAFIFFSLVLTQFVLQVSMLTKGVEYIATVLTNDDAYYYFQTAWNFKQVGFPTFDGIHATNGVQLLWFWIVAFIALLTPTKTVFLFAAMTITFLLNAMSYLIIWKLGETLQRPILSLYLASFWFLISFGTGVYSIGMENSLHAFIVWVVVWRATTFLIQAKNHERPNLWDLTILLTLNVWIRLDAALFSTVLYFCCLGMAFHTGILKLSSWQDIKYVVGSGLVAVSGLVIQLTTFHWMGGSYLPVSTLVKQTWSTWDRVLASSASLGIGAMMLLALIGPQLFKVSQLEQKTLIAFRSVWYCLLIGVILHLFVTAGIDAYRFYLWYLSPSYIFWLITFSVIIDSIGNIVDRRGLITLSWLVPLSICSLIILLSGVLFVIRLPIRNPLYVARYNAALWMAKNLPEDAICASWNAGQVGFFSERTVINLDGLINDFDYYNRVIQGPSSWTEYIQENEVDYLADHNRNRVVVPGFSVLQAFPVNDGSGLEFLIWKVPGPEAFSEQE